MSHVDKNLAARVVSFFETCLVHVKGEWAGQPFKLAEWQRDFLVKLFATVDDHGIRQYRKAFVAVPRKQGKTTVCAGIALYCMLADQEPGAEVYCCAADRNQAGIVFDIARQMMARSPRLASLAKPYQNRIVSESTGSFIRAMSSEAYTAHGVNAHAIIFDELHAQKTPDFWEVMRTSTGARRQPLTIAITTAGWDRNSICYAEWNYALKVRDGIIDDPTLLPVIYGADTDDDWADVATWRKANPNLGVSMKMGYLEEECRKAQELPRLENTFRQLHLNQWTEQAERWLPLDKWDACQADFSPGEVAGQVCFAGLDLASTRDLTALVLLFPSDDGYTVLPYFWLPRESMVERSRRDRVPYTEWVRAGLIKTTEGNVADYDVIRADINDLQTTFNIREIAIDRWNSTQLQTQLAGDGFEIVPFGQGFASMSSPSKELEKLVVAGTIRHDGNPVLRWMASNVAADTDAAANIKPNKARSSEKIDGIVALIMALGRAAVWDGSDGVSVYSKRGVLTV